MKWTYVFLLSMASLCHLPASADDARLKQAYQAQQSDLQIKGRGKVICLLADDNEGSRHQKFI